MIGSRPANKQIDGILGNGCNDSQRGYVFYQ